MTLNNVLVRNEHSNKIQVDNGGKEQVIKRGQKPYKNKMKLDQQMSIKKFR